MSSGSKIFASVPVPTEDFPGTERFQIRNRLGAGGFGVVYHAFDQQTNSQVALKVLHKTDAESLYAFKQEFRALTDVTHPNLVLLYELLSNQEHWFFTMELVQGINLLDFVWQRDRILSTNCDVPTIKVATLSRPEPEVELATAQLRDNLLTKSVKKRLSSLRPTINQRLDLTRLRDVLKQIAEGVYALHCAGKLHRDIKPSNVLVTDIGRVVVLDFGLVLEQIDRESMKVVVGTPLYMSPEQCAGLPISQATDWYSLGVILYEALTGIVPFNGAINEVLENKQKYEPLAPSELIADIPEDLNDLCWELLRHDPEKRPKGPEILARLGQGHQLAYQISPRAIPLIGRERHIAILMDAFQVSRRGRAITCYLRGRSGMGKSSLVRTFLERVQQQEQDQVIVLVGRCYEQESVPYKALDSLMDALSQYLKRLSAAELHGLIPDGIAALAQLFPVLRQVESIARAESYQADKLDSQEQRRRGFAALRELFVRMADRPLILFIDDLHWGDIDSAMLLSELLRPPDAPALLLIGSYRSEDAANSAFLQQWLNLQHNPSSGDTRMLSVEELTATEARELTLTLLGKADSERLVQVDEIVQESSGNPFFIAELVRYLQESDDALAAAGISATLDEVIYLRVQRLPESARRLLEVLAIAGQPLTSAMVGQIAQVIGKGQAALVVLRAGHLIRSIEIEAEEWIETYHERIRETIISHLTIDERRELHYQIATAFETASQTDPELLAVHYQGAQQYHSAAKYALLAAQRAAQALAFARAAQLYRLALEIYTNQLKSTPTDLPLSTIRISLGEALANAGRGAEAAHAFLAAASELRQLSAKNVDQVIKLQQWAAEQLLRGGHIDDGLAIFRELLSKLGINLSEKRAPALITMLIKRIQIRLRGLEFHEQQSEQLSADELLRIDTFWSVAMGLGIVDTVRGTEFQARHLLMALNAGEPYRVARALAVEAAYAALDGGRNRARTEDLVARALSLAQRINHPHAIALAKLMAGLTSYCLGQFKQARELTEEAETVLRKRASEFAYEFDIAQLFLLRSMFFRGELIDIAQRLPLLLKDAQERGDLYAVTNLSTRIAYINYLVGDQADEGRRVVRQALQEWSQQGFFLQHFFSLVAHAEIALYCGDYRNGWDLLGAQWPELKRSLILNIQVLNIESLHLRARCALAAATVTQQNKQLLKQAEQIAAQIEREQMIYGNAFAAAIRAGIAAMRNQRELAIKLLKSSEHDFEQADMALYAIAVRRRRGELLGGSEGNGLVLAADEWMRGQKIKNPQLMANMLAPGKYS